MGGLHVRRQTAEAVEGLFQPTSTPLKQGVNEKRKRSEEFCPAPDSRPLPQAARQRIFGSLNTSSESGSRSSAAERLCLACGLCCNGVIFADVRLQVGDDADRLRSLGLPLRPARKLTEQKVGLPFPILKFHQPCAAFDGCRCRIYADRPRYCREFECALLKSVGAGQVRPRAALRVIRSTRRQVDAALTLLRELGDADVNLPLAARFRRTARRLTNQELDKATAERYGRLTLAIHDLNLLLGGSFYPGSGA